jgi:hypothetical protein
MLAVGVIAVWIGASVGWTGSVQTNQGKQKENGPGKKPKPKFTISKETTYVTGPLDKDGYIDYVTALNQKLSQGVTPENNANVLLWKAFGPRPDDLPMPEAFYKWLGIPEPPEKGDYFIGERRFAKEHLKIKNDDDIYNFYEEVDLATARPWTPQQYPNVAAWLKANEKPLALIVEASKRGHYFSPLLPSEKGPLPGVLKFRESIDALAARAMLLAGQGKHNEAWQNLLACHRLGRLVGRGGDLVFGLLFVMTDSTACHADLACLDSAKWDAKQTRDHLNDLHSLPAFPQKLLAPWQR